MGSRPSKVAPTRIVRSRSGLSFVSTSTTNSINTLDDNEQEVLDGVYNFRFEEVSIKSFRVKWDRPENFNVKCYQVRLFPPDKIKSRTLLRDLPSPSYTFTRLRSSTLYTVGVVAVDEAGRKTPCTTGAVCTLPRPPGEISFPSQSSSDSISVKWKHCKGKLGFYSVEVAKEEDQTPFKQTTNIKENHTGFKGLIPGMEYSVTVKHVINGIASDASTKAFTLAPRHICDVRFSDVTQHEMTVKWKKPEGRVDSYTLKLSEKASSQKPPIVIERLQETSFIFNGLTSGTLYNCNIFSNAGNKSSKVQTFSQCTVPAKVSGITAHDIGPEEALVTWTPAAGIVDSYDLFLSPKEGVLGDTTPHGITGASYKFTGLVPGTVYTVGIVTNSEDKSSKRVTFTFATVPGMCGDIEISQTERSCTTQRIKWPPALGRVDSYVINIRREDKMEDGWTIENLFQPHYMLTDLTPGTSYSVNVVAMRDGIESSSVSEVFGTVPSDVPSIFFTKEQCTFDAINLSWETCVGGVERYLLTGKCEGGASMEVYVSSECSEYLFTGLHPATIYEFSVTAISNGVSSAAKMAKQITGPSNVQNLQAKSINKREVFVSWNSPSGGADEYAVKIHLQDDGHYELPLEQSTIKTEHTFSNLIPGSFYNIQVTPVSNMIKGKPVSTKTFTKPGNVVTPHIPGESVTPTSFSIKWWGVEGSCKDVDVILTRLRKDDTEDSDVSPVVIKEERVVSRDGANSEVTFDGLDSGTTYGVRLRAVSAHGEGEDSTFTQTTLVPSSNNKQNTEAEVNSFNEEPEKPTKDLQNHEDKDNLSAFVEIPSVETKETETSDSQENTEVNVTHDVEESNSENDNADKNMASVLVSQKLEESQNQETSTESADKSLTMQTSQENEVVLESNTKIPNTSEETQHIFTNENSQNSLEIEENRLTTSLNKIDTIKDLAISSNDVTMTDQPVVNPTSDVKQPHEPDNDLFATETDNSSTSNKEAVSKSNGHPAEVNLEEKQLTDKPVVDNSNVTAEIAASNPTEIIEDQSLPKDTTEIDPILTISPDKDMLYSTDSESQIEEAKVQKLYNRSEQLELSDHTTENSNLTSNVKENNTLAFLATLESADG